MPGAPDIVKAWVAALVGVMPPNQDKAARLAEQLRANLKRRKAQARGLVAPAPLKPDDGTAQDA